MWTEVLYTRRSGDIRVIQIETESLPNWVKSQLPEIEFQGRTPYKADVIHFL